MKQAITQYVYMEKLSIYSEFKPSLWPCKVDDTDLRIYIGKQEFEIQIPDDFDPTARQLAALEKLRDEVRAEFTAKLNEINTRISNLQALNYEVPA